MKSSKDVKNASFDNVKQLTTEEAITMAENKVYETLNYDQKVSLQLFQDKLCMPFEVFHEAVEKTLGRPVYTHEFAFPDLLRKEYLGDRAAPDLNEILNLIPNSKIVVVTNE